MHRGSKTKFPWWYFLHTGDSGWPMRRCVQERAAAAAATVCTNTSPSHSSPSSNPFLPPSLPPFLPSFLHTLPHLSPLTYEAPPQTITLLCLWLPAPLHNLTFACLHPQTTDAHPKRLYRVQILQTFSVVEFISSFISHDRMDVIYLWNKNAAKK